MTTAQKSFAEIFGTFSLVFVGTGAIVVNNVSGGAVTHVGVSLVFGLVVMAMIYAIGDVSGAHINPAMTFGFWLSGRLPAKAVPMYVVSQAIGAFAASGLLWALFPEHPNLGGTLPRSDAFVVHAFVFEVALTFMLMYVVLAVSSGPKEKGTMAGIAVGGVIAFEALMGGPISGASMNPIRSLAPAIVSGATQHLWVYIAAPLAGAAMAVGLFRVFGHRTEPRQEG